MSMLEDVALDQRLFMNKKTFFFFACHILIVFSRVSLVWWSYVVVFLRITSLFNELERGEEIKEILGRVRTCDLRI